jgi:ergothioneine biosynthesis protein EgtB
MIEPSPSMSPLSRRYADTRARSLALVQPLSEADCQAQSMADASPAKWHLAHTTWFFETFVLEAHETGFAPFHPAYRVLFNSYYQGVGAMHGRPQRGLLTRPSLAEVLRWREQVDARVQRLIGEPATDAVARLVELGVQHEQQHQELLLTDVLHLFSCNPLLPAYREDGAPAALAAAPPGWQRLAGGLVEIGHRAGTFAFDNESPRHRVWLEPYALADRLTTQGEWLEFMQAGGYGEPRWWLSAGWDWVRANALQAPLYWRRAGLRGDEWAVFGLHGLQPLAPPLRGRRLRTLARRP